MAWLHKTYERSEGHGGVGCGYTLGAGLAVRESVGFARDACAGKSPAHPRLEAPRTKGVRRSVIAEPAGERVRAVGSKEVHCSMEKRLRLWFTRVASVRVAAGFRRKRSGGGRWFSWLGKGAGHRRNITKGGGGAKSGAATSAARDAGTARAKRS